MNCLQKKIPNSCFGNFCCVSRSLGLLVYGTKYDSVVFIYDIRTESLKNIRQESTQISSLSVVGGHYLLIGGCDCSINVYHLPTLNHIMISHFHSDTITSICGCADSGIVVSIDRGFQMVIESLLKPYYHKIMQIPKGDFAPLIVTYKSGIIATIIPGVTSSTLKLFDIVGNEIKSTYTEGRVVEIEKLYLPNSQEMLVILNSQGLIRVYDMSQLVFVSSLSIDPKYLHFSPIKGKRAIQHISNTGQMMTVVTTF